MTEEGKKLEKHHELVSWAELQPLVNRLSNAGMSEKEQLAAIGFSSGYYTQARVKGEARKVVKIALEGMVGKLNGKVSREFSLEFDEAETVFDALKRLRKAFPNSSNDQNWRRLQSKIALYMAILAEGDK